MCPTSSTSIAPESKYWTDEAIFMTLFNFKRGKPLPSNVTSDVNPYHYQPEDLPVDLWYLCSGVKKDADFGSWIEKGNACEIFSNSAICGLKTTLQFYEGWGPHARKTDWMMQEYRITEKCDNDTKDHNSLCRVFLADEHKPSSTHCIDDIEAKISSNSGLKKISHVNGTEHENSFDMDCISRGDYIELNDLIDLGSPSSSSANSSCLTMTSDEYFDSIALLHELDKHIIDQELKDSSVKFNLSAQIMSKEVVIQPAISVSLTNSKDSKLIGEDLKLESRKESTSNGIDTTAFSREGNESVRRTKKRKTMKYLCFLVR